MLLIVPTSSQAGFFSSLLGDEAFAQTDKGVPPPSPIENSQTMTLLQANVSSASIIDDKGNNSKNDQINDAEDLVNIVSDNALLPATGPLGVSDGKEVVDPFSLEGSVYVIRKGDSISTIASMFDVSTNTILWANDMKKGDKLVEGDVLLILPVSGLEHTVAKGQTLQSIASLYKVDINDIIQYNDISLDTKLAIGDKLIIPDAQKSEESGKPLQNPAASIAKDKKYYETHPVKNLSGYYVNPVPGYRKSQGLHDSNSVDLAIARGTPVHAAASGTVIVAKSGCVEGQRRCGGGFGNLVVISHPNGTKTWYAHLSKVITTIGAQVSQGQVIGNVGSTGHSTGPHVHFRVDGARNPGADGSWKY